MPTLTQENFTGKVPESEESMLGNAVMQEDCMFRLSRGYQPLPVFPLSLLLFPHKIPRFFLFLTATALERGWPSVDKEESLIAQERCVSEN